MFFCELALRSEVGEKFPTSYVGHQKVQVTTILCESFQTNLQQFVMWLLAYKEWVIDIGQNGVL